MTGSKSDGGGTSSSSGRAGGVGSRRVIDSRSLTVVVLDASPLVWGGRDLRRTVSDKARAEKGKTTVGPGILEEVINAVQSFASAYCTIEREAGIVLSAVADNETAVLYPRKDQLAEWLAHPDSYVADTRKIKEDFTTGVAELMARAAHKSAARSDPSVRQGAMASALSSALCIINRFLVVARGGSATALHNSQFSTGGGDDGGIVALMGSGGGKNKKSSSSGNRPPSSWSPRVLLIQASEDRSRDYNAFMNCAFAAVKNQVVVDGCFLSSSGNKSSSAFLEQICDLTGGVFLAPTGLAQVGGALTEVLFSVFLAPLSCRPSLNLPALNKVDFRARCFETAEIVDRAFVCNQCLSIFQDKPKGNCPTCQARIITTSTTPSSSSSNKKTKFI